MIVLMSIYSSNIELLLSNLNFGFRVYLDVLTRHETPPFVGVSRVPRRIHYSHIDTSSFTLEEKTLLDAINRNTFAFTKSHHNSLTILNFICVCTYTKTLCTTRLHNYTDSRGTPIQSQV